MNADGSIQRARVGVVVHRAESLVGLGATGLSNPFVSVSVGQVVFSTPAVQNSVNPSFEASFSFPDCPIPTILTLRVLHQENGGQESMLGSATLTLFSPSSMARRTLQLGHGGDVQLSQKARDGCGSLDISYEVVASAAGAVPLAEKKPPTDIDLPSFLRGDDGPGDLTSAYTALSATPPPAAAVPVPPTFGAVPPPPAAAVPVPPTFGAVPPPPAAAVPAPPTFGAVPPPPAAAVPAPPTFGAVPPPPAAAVPAPPTFGAVPPPPAAAVPAPPTFGAVPPPPAAAVDIGSRHEQQQETGGSSSVGTDKPLEKQAQSICSTRSEAYTSTAQQAEHSTSTVVSNAYTRQIKHLIWPSSTETSSSIHTSSESSGDTPLVPPQPQKASGPPAGGVSPTSSASNPATVSVQGSDKSQKRVKIATTTTTTTTATKERPSSAAPTTDSKPPVRRESEAERSRPRSAATPSRDGRRPSPVQGSRSCSFSRYRAPSGKRNNTFTSQGTTSLSAGVRAPGSQNPTIYQYAEELLAAAEQGDIAVFQRLREEDPQLSRGFENVRDYSGRTILHIAAWYGHVQVLKTLLQPAPLAPLLELRALRSVNGNTILHSAAQAGRVDVVQWLRFSTTSASLIGLRNSQGITATDCAREAGFMSIAVMLGETA
uniref:C2 domain-containing protein n=1 Tax=Trypanosoma congolense (strain IL3000) TaxID=1068625 RepID=G0UQG8_TRYCI|nr:conserved hypothetical protein [Trypanosoma congolense IL3000]